MRTSTLPPIAFGHAGDCGPKILFVMGLGGSGDLWEPQLVRLEGTHQVAWFDHRGLGASEKVASKFDLTDLARDVLRVADDLGWDTFHLVGISMGGMVAQEAALLAPSRIKSLTLVATHSGGPFALWPGRTGVRAFVRCFVGTSQTRIEGAAEMLYSDSFRRKEGDYLRHRIRERLARMPKLPAKTLALQLRAIRRFDVRSKIHAIRTPTLVVKPKYDVLVHPRHSDHLAARIPRAKLVELPAGHGVQFECADELTALIADHVGAHEGRAVA